jgi:putative ABC transport system substrate-binding protein
VVSAFGSRRAQRLIRRLKLILFLWLCSVAPVFAQNSESLPIVGVLRISTLENVAPFPTVFRDALAALGQVDGRNIRIDLRLAEGHAERFPELAQALVREKVSVIVASGDAAVRAAQQATKTIPIVGIVDDIVGAGLIDSLAKPGSNTTGVSILAGELDAKRLEILKQLVPSRPSFAVLHDPASTTAQSVQLADAARQLGIELHTVDVRSPADFASAFTSLRALGSEAVVMLSSPLIFSFRSELCELSLTYKLPAISQVREMAEAGCLVSYGIRISEAYVIAAALTDKMLKGARAGDTPAQQPTRFELVINLRTAKAIGLAVPHCCWRLPTR